MTSTTDFPGDTGGFGGFWGEKYQGKIKPNSQGIFQTSKCFVNMLSVISIVQEKILLRKKKNKPWHWHKLKHLHKLVYCHNYLSYEK